MNNAALIVIVFGVVGNNLSSITLKFNLIAPLIILIVSGMVNVCAGLFLPKSNRYIYFGLALFGIILTFIFTLNLWGVHEAAFHGLLKIDNFALIFDCIFLVSAGLCMLLAVNHFEGNYLLYPEFFAILSFATVGMMLLASSTHLLTLFIGLETLSISLYILAGIKRNETKSLEAAFKYFLLGAFASGFLLYGMAFVYGATGSLDLTTIATGVVNNPMHNNLLFVLGGVLIIAGLAFKIALAPFHIWAADVYQGAPTPVTAFFATGSKAAGFAALLRVTFSAVDGLAVDWVTVFWVLACLSMFVGNIAALLQTNIKRLLAYSSIAHAGYILMGVVAWNDVGAASVIFYLLSYTFMNAGAFGVLALLNRKDKECQDLNDIKGLAMEKPAAAILMALFMFSLAGLPPTAGFVGKFYLFSAAVKAGHIPLVIIGVLNSMMAVYYYLKVVVNMFMKDAEQERPITRWMPAVYVCLMIAAIGTIGLGIFPSQFIVQFQNLIGVM
ncbi:MAG: NADH-quinone oxidoreductase subunit N [bacterium]